MGIPTDAEAPALPMALGRLQALVMELADLARLAESQDQVLFVWMHPLRT